MTKPWRVDVLECRGSSYDVGKQMAEGFLKTSRGRAYGRRRERRPFAFSLRNAEAALQTWAPNIWEELHGLADGLKIPLERAVAEYSNGRLRYPPRGCSAVMSGGLYGRNYDYDVGHYDRILVAIQPTGVHASIGFSDRFTGRLDGMNEHGLCVGLHQVNNGSLATGPRLHPDRAHGARSMRHDARGHRAAAPDSPWRRLQLFPDGRAPARRRSSRQRPRRWPCARASSWAAAIISCRRRCRPTTGAIPAPGGICRRSRSSPAQRPAGRPAVQGAQQLALAGFRPPLRLGFRHASYDRLHAG